MRLALVVAGLVAAALPAFGQAKVGDKATVMVESTIDLEITVRDGSLAGETQRILNLVRRETFEQDVLEAAAGQATSVRIKVLSSKLQRSGTDTPLEDKPTALSGQTYTSSRGAEGWVARDAEGGAAPVEGISMGAWNDAGRLLPKEGLKQGGQWSVEAAQVQGLITPAGIHEATGKLSCTCESSEGDKAVITFTGTIAGKGKGEAQVAFTVTGGRMEYDLSKGRPSVVTVTGSLESTTSVEDTFRKPGTEGIEEKRKIGEISVRSRDLKINLSIK